MDNFELARLIRDQARGDKPYNEFLRKPSLSMGVYVLPAGGVDKQQPHTEDEVYYVVEGRGMIRVGAEDEPVEPGSIVFVDKGVEHRFHTISQDLKLLVFFAPAQGTDAA